MNLKDCIASIVFIFHSAVEHSVGLKVEHSVGFKVEDSVGLKVEHSVGYFSPISLGRFTIISSSSLARFTMFTTLICSLASL